MRLSNLPGIGLRATTWWNVTPPGNPTSARSSWAGVERSVLLYHGVLVRHGMLHALVGQGRENIMPSIRL